MILSLRSLRFVFIMLVVMSHIIGKSFDFGGECGVSFFFVLSGFVLSYAYGQLVLDGQFRLKPFLKKQLLKFYPLYMLTFLVMLALDMRLGVSYNWLKLLANVLLLQSWVPADDFYFVANAPSWFLSDLMFFYVVFGWLFLWLNTVSLRKIVLVGLVVLGLYTILVVNIPQSMVNPVLYVSPITRLLDFSLGILLFRLCMSPRGECIEAWFSRQSVVVVSCIEVLTVLWVVGSFFVYQQLGAGFRCASLFWLVSPIFLFVYIKTEKSGGILTVLLHHPVMQWLGSISFEIYLTHYVILRVLYSLLAASGMEVEGRLSLQVVILTILLIIIVSYAVKILYVDRIFAMLKKYL